MQSCGATQKNKTQILNLCVPRDLAPKRSKVYWARMWNLKASIFRVKGISLQIREVSCPMYFRWYKSMEQVGDVSQKESAGSSNYVQ